MAQVTTYRGAFIDGEWVAGGGEEITVTNPDTGEAVGSVSAATPDQIDLAVASARRAFESWRRTTVLAAMLGACLPDADKPSTLFFGRSPFPAAVDRWHWAIQRESPRRLPQEFAVAAAGALALRGVRHLRA